MKTYNLLIVAPYGIGVRDTLLNERLGNWLSENALCAIVSPYEFADRAEWPDSRSLGISRGRVADRLLRSINHRAFSVVQRTSFKRFHLEADWQPVYEALLMVARLTPSSYADYDRWDRLGRTIHGRAMRAISSHFPALYPGARGIRKYDAVFVTHPTDPECAIMAQAARKQGVPVIAMSIGVDNLLTGGPMLFAPDLMFLWGSVQEHELREHHARFYPALSKVATVQVGALGQDGIASTGPLGTRAFVREYPKIDPRMRVVTFAAYLEVAYPDQAATCRVILDTLDEAGGGHLVVRARPGLDEGYWRSFVAERAGRVTLQIPRGALFKKWGQGMTLDRATELEDIDLYASTLRRSCLVVTGGYSTVFLDAYAAGTPSVPAVLPATGETESFLSRMYALYAKSVPYAAKLDFVRDRSSLRRAVLEAQAPEGRAAILARMKPVFDEQVVANDGRAGERAAAAIAAFLDQRKAGQ